MTAKLAGQADNFNYALTPLNETSQQAQTCQITGALMVIGINIHMLETTSRTKSWNRSPHLTTYL